MLFCGVFVIVTQLRQPPERKSPETNESYEPRAFAITSESRHPTSSFVLSEYWSPSANWRFKRNGEQSIGAILRISRPNSRSATSMRNPVGFVTNEGLPSKPLLIHLTTDLVKLLSTARAICLAVMSRMHSLRRAPWVLLEVLLVFWATVDSLTAIFRTASPTA